MPDRPTRCPVCGEGTLADIDYDDSPLGAAQQQQPESRQVDIYSCGHEVPRARLMSADDRLDVERRTSDETAEPLPGNEQR